MTQFQSVKNTYHGTLDLVISINQVMGENALDEQQLKETFDRWWPDLETILKDLPPEYVTNPPKRSERDILEEILELVRNISRSEEKSEFKPRSTSSRFLLNEKLGIRRPPPIY